MIGLKNGKDIKYIKKAIKIGETTLSKISSYVELGVTTLELNDIIESIVIKLGGKSSVKGYKGFPSATCISVNREIIHGIPNSIPLKEGDIVKIDIGVEYKGYYSDQARTFVVGRLKSIEHDNLLHTTELALIGACELAHNKCSLKELSQFIEKSAREAGLGILRDYCGHGVGFAVHEEPRIPNVNHNIALQLKKGMILAIEPMFVIGQGFYTIKSDGWTVIADGIGSHFEKTIII